MPPYISTQQVYVANKWPWLYLVHFEFGAHRLIVYNLVYLLSKMMHACVDIIHDKGNMYNFSEDPQS